jgi:hypothetical protein
VLPYTFLASLQRLCFSLIIKFLFLGKLKTSDSEHLEEKNPGKETSVRLIVSLLTTQVPPLVQIVLWLFLPLGYLQIGSVILMAI